MRDELVDYVGRKAPYAPTSALVDFLDRMRDIRQPARLDRRFLQKMNVAPGNEWALLSALKFLGIIDERGVPTPVYRAFWHPEKLPRMRTLSWLVIDAYKELIDAGGLSMSNDELQAYFRVASSPSQAKNAARFFRDICRMANLTQETYEELISGVVQTGHSPPDLDEWRPRHRDSSTSPPYIDIGAAPDSPVTKDMVAQTKLRLFEKLPPPRPDWTAEAYQTILRTFRELLDYLDQMEERAEPAQDEPGQNVSSHSDRATALEL